MATATTYKHIKLNDKGIPIIDGTAMKVVELVEGQLGTGWTPEETQFQFPHLSLDQVRSALAYYCDHKAELDAALLERSRSADEILKSLPPNPAIERLRAAKYR